MVATSTVSTSEQAQIRDQQRSWDLEDGRLGLSSPTVRALKNKGVRTVGELIIRRPDSVQNYRNLGPTRMKEIQSALAKLDIDWR